MLDVSRLKDVLARMDAALDEPVTLCLIGSGATILMGQPNRSTDDIDAWARASLFREDKVKRAAEAVGLTWDPKDEIATAPYVQVVHPGIVQVPGWDAERRQWLGQPEEVAWRGEKLTVTLPPAECIIASKLVRGADRDMEDCLWLMAARAIDAKTVVTAVRGLPARAREQARENLEILNLMRPRGT